ncbi:MAG: regulatory protein RecX [Eubacteriales bacterium]
MPEPTPSGDEECQFNQAKATAYRLLSTRRRTSGEVAGRLLQKGFADGVVHKTVSFLQGYGFLDDLAYARDWVDQKADKYGAARLRKDLLDRGISPVIVGHVLGGTDEDAEYRRALELAKKRLARHVVKDYPLPRLSRFLERHGFSGDIIGRVCRTLRSEAL